MEKEIGKGSNINLMSPSKRFKIEKTRGKGSIFNAIMLKLFIMEVFRA